MIIIKPTILNSTIRHELGLLRFRGRDYGFMRLRYRIAFGYYIEVSVKQFPKAVEAIKAWHAEHKDKHVLPHHSIFAFAFATDKLAEIKLAIMAENLTLADVSDNQYLVRYPIPPKSVLYTVA